MSYTRAVDKVLIVRLWSLMLTMSGAFGVLTGVLQGSLWRQWLIAILAVVMVPAVAVEPITYITVPRTGDVPTGQNKYFIELLQLALDKTANTDGEAQIRFYDYSLTSSRLMSDLEHTKTIDVVWNGTNAEREEILFPIKISLLKRLNGYRVLLIRKEDQASFSRVQTLADLRKFRAGSGADWPSTELLRNNDLPLLTASKKTLLFSMLKARRFDYMTRNLCEVWEEADELKKDGIVIEQELLLHSGIPFYFFVSRDNPALAARIQRGLEIASKDGSFDKLFNETPCFQQGMQELVSHKRRVLRLDPTK